MCYFEIRTARPPSCDLCTLGAIVDELLDGMDGEGKRVDADGLRQVVEQSEKVVGCYGPRGIQSVCSRRSTDRPW